MTAQKDIHWKRHARRVETSSGPLDLIDFGAGSPVVLVHGLGGNWQNWLENIPHLARSGRRVIAVDLPGFGTSPAPEWTPGPTTYALALAHLFDALGVDRADVVGNSMGGMIAVAVACDFPERVRRLVLVDPGGITTHSLWNPIESRLIEALSMNSALCRIAAEAVARSGLVQRATVVRQGIVATPNGIRSGVLREIVGGSVPRPSAWSDALRGAVAYDVRGRLARVRAPSLVVWGERDGVLPARDADAFVAGIPDSRKEVISDAAHLPMAERPEVFNPLVETFLAA